ncbi:hypothetical protein ACFLTH_12565 [Bacteroidota bacterium]
MKKAQVEKYMVEIGVGIVILIVVLMILKFSFSGMFFAVKERQCGNSVLAHTKTITLNEMAGKNTENIPPIQCPTLNYTISKKKEKEIKYEIAEKMRICWENWQKGEKKLFLEEEIYCHPCYIVDFKYDDIKINDFDKFLAETEIKGRDFTYMQYFSGHTNSPEFSIEEIRKNPDIMRQFDTDFSTDSEKVIMFYYIRDRETIYQNMDIILGGAAIGAGIGGALTIGTCVVMSIATGGIATIACGIAAASIASGAVAGGYVGGQIADNYPLWLAYIMFLDYDEETFKNLKCSRAPGKQTNLYENTYFVK